MKNSQPVVHACDSFVVVFCCLSLLAIAVGGQVAQIAKALKDTGVFGVELGVKDIFQLLNTMELDLKVQRVRQSANDDDVETQASDSLEAVGAVMFATQGTPVRYAAGHFELMKSTRASALSYLSLWFLLLLLLPPSRQSLV